MCRRQGNRGAGWVSGVAGLASLMVLLAVRDAAGGQAPPVPEPAAERTAAPCLVCRHRIDGERVIIHHLGRTVHLHPDVCETHWHEDPDGYFASLQPRAALFQEMDRSPPLAGGWLIFGIYVLAGLVFGAICAYIAIGRRQPALAWFFGGLGGNVFALLALLTRPRGDVAALPQGVPGGLRKVPTTRAPVSCPECGAENHPSARACSGCDRPLEPTAESEVDRARR